MEKSSGVDYLRQENSITNFEIFRKIVSKKGQMEKKGLVPRVEKRGYIKKSRGFPAPSGNVHYTRGGLIYSHMALNSLVDGGTATGFKSPA